MILSQRMFAQSNWGSIFFCQYQQEPSAPLGGREHKALPGIIPHFSKQKTFPTPSVILYILRLTSCFCLILYCKKITVFLFILCVSLQYCSTFFQEPQGSFSPTDERVFSHTSETFSRAWVSVEPSPPRKKAFSPKPRRFPMKTFSHVLGHLPSSCSFCSQDVT